jgi:hypothetical protein
MATIRITSGSTSPPVEDVIYDNENEVIDLSGASVRFLMRPVDSSQLTVNAAATITSAALGTVSYQWVAGDTATEGEYRAWWKITTSTSAIIQTPEFRVYVDGVGPGEANPLGEIASQVQQVMPVTWSALSKDSRYGDRMLATRINYVKYKLFSTVVSATMESTAYNPLLLDYVAKEAALQIIPAGIDYWMEQHITSSTNGTSEAVSYPDRIRHLEKLQEWLFKEVAELREELPGEFTVRKRGRGPAVSNTTVGTITPDPADFGEMTDEGLPSNLPWGPF